MEHRPTWMDSFKEKTDSNLEKKTCPQNQKLTGVSNPFYIKVEIELLSVIKKCIS